MRLVNGQAAEFLSLNDRAIQFGDGVFRTIRLEQGRLVFWARHYRKLAADCAALGIEAPAERTLLDEARSLIAHSGMRDATIKLIVSRGESQRGYAAPAECRPTRIVQILPLPAYPERLYREGARVRLCETRASWQPMLAGVKHLNRLENVLARREWSDPSILEGLLLDRDGFVLEGVTSNVLALRDGVLQTPLLDGGGVAGVLREVALDTARQLGWRVEACRLSLDDLRAAERVWISNSLMGLMPVAALDAHGWRVDSCDGLTVEITRMMRDDECF